MTIYPAKWVFKLMLWMSVSFSFLSASQAEDGRGGSTGYDEKAKPQWLGNPGKIRVTVNEKSFLATLAKNETAKDFASLLPLTLTMKDLFGREKFAGLPRAISTAGPRSFTYEVGDVILWSPGPDVAIFYSHDGETIPSPGGILIAKADAGVELIAVRGAVTVKVELVQD